MCQYYEHSFLCKHTSHSFARFCPKGNLIQTPCGKTKEVWHTIRMDDACDECQTWYPDRYYPKTRRTMTTAAPAQTTAGGA